MQLFRKRRRWAGYLMTVAAGCLMVACSPDKAPAPDKQAATSQGIPVSVATARRKTVTLRVQGIGNVESPVSVAVKSRIDGQIVKVNFRDGADVAKGQVLFEIDPRPATAQLKAAEAKLASDMAQRNHAEEQDRRYQDLLRRKFISPDGYAQYKTNLDSANATVEADRAAVEAARLELGFATIRSPIAGRAGRVLIQRGNLVKANDTNPLVTVNQLSPIYVNFALPEQYLSPVRAALRAGRAAVDIRVDGAGGEAAHVPGQLAFVDNTVDVSTGTIKLRASVPNRDATLWPGQFVTATVALGELPDALVVPSEAVQTGPDGSFVFVVDAGARARMRKVAVDRVAGHETLIASGLKGGEQVVVDGQSRLKPGSPVAVKAAGPTSR